CVFSALAAGGQWWLHRHALLSSSMVSTSGWLGGMLLLGAGIFQFTPLKQACLTHCRGPLEFIMTRWREGSGGAFRMGLEHGAFCTGCCWALMALLFVAGVMNIFWIAALTVLVCLEKMLPARALPCATGLGAASSSCSYAAVALARSIFRTGADFTAAMAFELASTNLVAELTIIIIVLMGWQFALAEFAGGPLMVVLIAVLFRIFLSRKLVRE